MAKMSFVQINGKLYDKSKPLPEGVGEMKHGHFIIGDMPDFVSPIDGTLVRGRAGMREHCQKHNVVPTSELKGLSPKAAVQEYVPDRAAIRDALRRQVYK